MKIKAGIKGRPKKGDRRSMQTHCGYLHCDATDDADAHVLAAIYAGLTSDRFPALTKAISAAAIELFFKEALDTRQGVNRD